MDPVVEELNELLEVLHDKTNCSSHIPTKPVAGQLLRIMCSLKVTVAVTISSPYFPKGLVTKTKSHVAVKNNREHGLLLIRHGIQNPFNNNKCYLLFLL